MTKNGANSIDTRVHIDESHQEHGTHFEKQLRAWKEKHIEGVVIATMGMGDDGHTAGIMPHKGDLNVFNGLFEQESTWVVSYDAGKKNEFPLRTTVTNTFLRNEVNHALLYVSGIAKKDAINKVLEPRGTLYDFPARIIHEMKNVTLVTDIFITQK